MKQEFYRSLMEAEENSYIERKGVGHSDDYFTNKQPTGKQYQLQ